MRKSKLDLSMDEPILTLTLFTYVSDFSSITECLQTDLYINLFIGNNGFNIIYVCREESFEVKTSLAAVDTFFKLSLLSADSINAIFFLFRNKMELKKSEIFLQ